MNNTHASGVEKLLEQYGCGPISFSGTADGLYERHLLFDSVIAPTAAGARERFEAIARSVRDVLSQRWVRTESTYEQRNPKRIYYLSMEFLIGRSLANNVTNLLLGSIARDAAAQKAPRLAPRARGGARRGTGQRRPRAPGGVLPRLDGDPATAGHGLRATLRVRHLQAGPPGRLAAASSRTTGSAARTRGRWRGHTRRWRSP